MQSTSLRPSQPSPSDDGSRWLALARAMQRRQAADPGWRPLRGKNIGLLSDDETHEATELFTEAATALGARVALLCPDPNWPLQPDLLASTGHVLGRLYDAVECQRMAPAVVARLRSAAGIPVFDGAAMPAHPGAAAAARLEAGPSHEQARRLMLQALLLDALGIEA